MSQFLVNVAQQTSYVYDVSGSRTPIDEGSWALATGGIVIDAESAEDAAAQYVAHHGIPPKGRLIVTATAEVKPTFG